MDCRDAGAAVSFAVPRQIRFDRQRPSLCPHQRQGDHRLSCARNVARPHRRSRTEERRQADAMARPSGIHRSACHRHMLSRMHRKMASSAKGRELTEAEVNRLADWSWRGLSGTLSIIRFGEAPPRLCNRSRGPTSIRAAISEPTANTGLENRRRKVLANTAERRTLPMARSAIM